MVPQVLLVLSDLVSLAHLELLEDLEDQVVQQDQGLQIYQCPLWLLPHLADRQDL